MHEGQSVCCMTQIVEQELDKHHGGHKQRAPSSALIMLLLLLLLLLCRACSRHRGRCCRSAL